MGKDDVDPRILALCENVTAKRARTVIDHIIEHGQITTEELQHIYGYDHPPRAARDVREQGVPLDTMKVTSERTGRKIGAYRFADPSKIKRGRIGGRKAFSKAFKEKLIAEYESRDAITGERMEGRYLQIDHRVPYEVIGDEGHDESNLDEYMLLDSSSQRAKSWSCEACENWRDQQNVTMCRSCLWAFPESYTHVAMQDVRRVDIIWRGVEVEEFNQLKAQADAEEISVSAFIKRIVSS